MELNQVDKVGVKSMTYFKDPDFILFYWLYNACVQSVEVIPFVDLVWEKSSRNRIDILESQARFYSNLLPTSTVTVTNAHVY